MAMACRLLKRVKYMSEGWKLTPFLYRQSVMYVNPLTLKTPSFFPAVNLSSQTRKEFKSKKLPQIKINLVGLDENISVMYLQDAEKLAKRRDLKLVKVIDIDPKTQRSIYKLVTASNFFEEKRKIKKENSERRKSEIKGQKLLPLSGKIADYDLQSKMKMVKKWLSKNFEVAVVINGSDAALIGHIFQTMESSIQEMGTIAEKEKKSSQLKFKILPLRNVHVKTNEDESHSA